MGGGADPKRPWRESVIQKLTTQSDRALIVRQRQQAEEKLKRLGRAYVDGLFEEGDCQLQQRILKTQLESLVVPEVEASLQAGDRLSTLGLLWEKATLEERHLLLSQMVEAVYVDLTGSEKRVKGIGPRPAFRAAFGSTEPSPVARARLVG